MRTKIQPWPRDGAALPGYPHHAQNWRPNRCRAAACTSASSFSTPADCFSRRPYCNKRRLHRFQIVQPLAGIDPTLRQTPNAFAAELFQWCVDLLLPYRLVL